MKHPNAIILFARTPELTRSAGSEPFAALPWDDLDSIFHACAGDLVQAAAAVGETDVLVYRGATFPVERLMVSGGNGIRQFEMGPVPFDECVQQAVENAFLEYYHRVTVVVENNPLIGRDAFRTANEQLGVEDDCAVITPAEDDRVVLVALKANYPSLFVGKGGSSDGRSSGLLSRLCELDALVFPTQPSFTLGTTANIERLRGELSLRDPGSTDFPKRTSAVFRSLEKKYRWKKAQP